MRYADGQGRQSPGGWFAWLWSLLFILSACAPLAPIKAPPTAASVVAAQWQAPLPHQGKLSELARWWRQFDDPLLSSLIDSGQKVSPSLALAASRIEQARAGLVAADAGAGPTLDAGASLTRGRPDLSLPAATRSGASLQASWELDLFGAQRAAQDAARAQLQGASAAWHEARVALAAEIGLAYVNLRACESQLAQAGQDARSRRETARVAGLSAEAGFQTAAQASLARASAAQGRSNETQVRAQCDTLIKGLVALSAMEEPALRAQLTAGTARIPEPAQIQVHQVPAQALEQRPDIYRAARELDAASSSVAQSEAQRYPSIRLAGNIGAARLDAGNISLSGGVWTLGPLSISLPLFDGGRLRANVLAAKAAYDAALVQYTGRLRLAVREVEEALIGLQSNADRNADARSAAEGFALSYLSTEHRYRAGLASLFELEEVRRNALTAQSALIELRREQVAGWIALYRALGGGWTPDLIESRK